MTNEIQYFKNANWAMLNGAFTPEDLQDIIDRIKDPKIQGTPIESEARSEKAIKDTLEDARLRQEARNKYKQEE